ncbi:lysophospholipid acyltransferase family protein, partial [Streptomyces acidiscabies]|uniref:lysophospholipid acyltransferase family protein n=1 Tax=Streptomyces acidiscabies TaxID=42234 RepID=UPI0011810747
MSVWLPTAPCTPRACIEPGRCARVWGAPRLLAVVALILAGVAGSFVVRWLPGALVRTWARSVVRACGVRVRITGAAPPDGGLLVVANHISWLDVPLLAAVRPARMLAKREIRQWPVAGPIAARAALFIDRDRLRALPGTVATIAAAL